MPNQSFSSIKENRGNFYIIAYFSSFGIRQAGKRVSVAVEGEGSWTESTGRELHADVAWLLSRNDADGEFAVEGVHGGTCEDFGAGGVAVADALETACACDFDGHLIVGIGTEVAVLIDDADGEEGHVGAVGGQVGAVGGEFDVMRRTCRSHGFFAHLFAFFVIDDDTEFAGLVADVVPTQAITVEQGGVFRTYWFILRSL